VGAFGCARPSERPVASHAVMLMPNRRCYVEGVVQHDSRLVNVQVLGAPRRSIAMENVKC
jgi:hypothetical protein